MGAGYLSNLLIKNYDDFESEFNEVYTSGLDSTTWQHLDQTSARVKGINHTTNVVCNPLYTVYSTTDMQGRISSIRVEMTGEQQEIFHSWLRKSTTPVGLAKRETAILMLASGETFSKTSRYVGIKECHIRKWARRFVQQRLSAFINEWNTIAQPFNWSQKLTAKILAKCEIAHSNNTAQITDVIAA